VDNQGGDATGCFDVKVGTDTIKIAGVSYSRLICCYYTHNSDTWLNSTTHCWLLTILR